MEDMERTKFDSYVANNPDAKTNLLNNLRKSNIFCDAIIRLDCGSCIPIHRIILSTTCDYFHKLFMSELSDNDGNIYEIHFVRSEIMNCIIDFAYTLDCDLNEDNPTDLCELITTAEYWSITVQNT